MRRDLLDGPPPDVDVLLAADTWYEGPARGARPPLAPRRGGGRDPRPRRRSRRRYLPDPAAAGLTELARYEVRTTTVLEDRDVLEARVLTLA